MSYLKQSAVTFSTQILLMIFSMGAGIIVARLLGPELKGQAVLLSNATQLLFMLGSMGFGSAFSFFIAKKRYQPRQIMSLALFSSLLFGGIVNFCFFFTWKYHSSMWQGIPFNLIILSTLLAVLNIYSTYLLRIVVGFGRIYSMNLSNAVTTIINFVSVVFLLLVWPFGLKGVVYSLWLSGVAQVVVLGWMLRAHLVPKACWDYRFITETYLYGIKSHGLLIINFLNYRLDLFILQYLVKDAVEVGYYSLAVGMAELMWMVPNSVVAPLFSSVARSDADDRSVITLRTCRWSLIFLILLAVGGVMFGRLFLRLLYGADYLPSYEPFLWLLPGVCLFPIFKLFVIDLAARGLPGYGTVASAVALLVNVIANIILIPQFGAKGAAMATSFSYILMSIISLFFFMRITKYTFRDIFVVEQVEIQFIFSKIRQILIK
ncbi:MAG: hypothetical protein COA36_08875 [Desulfotalea sp.]|nr:MAG: hypothetical protein COA36_08875 [Desulfotalea sp.]